MPEKPSLLIVNNFHADTIAKLDARYETHHLWLLSETEKRGLIDRLEGSCEAAATASWVCDEIVYELGSLRVLSCFGVGVDGIDFERTAAAGIAVTNTPDVLNDAVADLAIALILATTRDIVNADRFVRAGEWLKGPLPFGAGLAGRTLGILGLGRIGSAIVRRAEPFGLRFAYHNRRRKDDVSFPYFESARELAENSDILLNMLPGGPETFGLVDLEVLDALGPEGIFINVGRGSSVNESALVQALRHGLIAGAGLDVYANEPNVPAELLTMDNVVLLPHIGSATVETRAAMGDLVVDNLDSWFSAHRLLTEVTGN
ncbi:MAG: 2-hydroxyacid dehydrogenase [Gammaproteobacteria bacterium]|nr:2-hydroxyacid dehydrogenase [Gammaproteobacteria bacterium]